MVLRQLDRPSSITHLGKTVTYPAPSANDQVGPVPCPWPTFGRPQARCCENFLYVFKAARNGPLAPPTGHTPRPRSAARLRCSCRTPSAGAERGSPGPPMTTGPRFIGVWGWSADGRRVAARFDGGDLAVAGRGQSASGGGLGLRDGQFRRAVALVSGRSQIPSAVAAGQAEQTAARDRQPPSVRHGRLDVAVPGGGPLHEECGTTADGMNRSGLVGNRSARYRAATLTEQFTFAKYKKSFAMSQWTFVREETERRFFVKRFLLGHVIKWLIATLRTLAVRDSMRRRVSKALYSPLVDEKMAEEFRKGLNEKIESVEQLARRNMASAIITFLLFISISQGFVEELRLVTVKYGSLQAVHLACLPASTFFAYRYVVAYRHLNVAWYMKSELLRVSARPFWDEDLELILASLSLVGPRAIAHSAYFEEGKVLRSVRLVIAEISTVVPLLVMLVVMAFSLSQEYPELPRWLPRIANALGLWFIILALIEAIPAVDHPGFNRTLDRIEEWGRRIK